MTRKYYKFSALAVAVAASITGVGCASSDPPPAGAGTDKPITGLETKPMPEIKGPPTSSNADKRDMSAAGGGGRASTGRSADTEPRKVD